MWREAVGLGHSLATMQKKKTVKVPRGKASEESLEVVPRGSEELKAALAARPQVKRVLLD